MTGEGASVPGQVRGRVYRWSYSERRSNSGERDRAEKNTGEQGDNGDTLFSS